MSLFVVLVTVPSRESLRCEKKCLGRDRGRVPAPQAHPMPIEALSLQE
jgi:hypothetical protein